MEEKHIKSSQAIERTDSHHATVDKVDSCLKVQAHTRASVVTGTFSVDEIYPPLPEIDELALAQRGRAGQGLAQIQCMGKFQRRESVIHPTCSIGPADNKNVVHPIPKKSQAENEIDIRETMNVTGTKDSSYGVTLTPRTDNSPKKTNRYRSSSVWWPGPRCTTWWNGCSKEKNKNFTALLTDTF